MRPLSIVHTEASSGWGGQEIRILSEASGMLGRGHHVRLITPPETPIAAAAARAGIPVTALPIQKKGVQGFRSLRRWLEVERRHVDIINTHSSTDSWLTAIACATMRDGPPIVRTRHVSTEINNGVATRWLYADATAHIVTTGEALRGQLTKSLRIPNNQVTSVPTGIDLDRFIPGDAHAARERLGLSQQPVLGCVATLRNWKGHDYLFEAIALDRQGWRGWTVLVVGDGPHRPKLEAHLAALGLGDMVRFVGQQDDVVPWLQAMDMVTLPSYGEEGVPQAIMQAMACGKAVVSTPVGAIAEAVDQEVTGLLVAPRSAEALGLGLARLRDDEALRVRLGAHALERARRDFGIGAMLDRMEAIFGQVSGVN
jgi:glycosyltransferase involved in cell wall biosynthesis